MRHRIAVVGSGPGGLTFARVLHRHGHPVTVLERDPAPDARPPGGTLDLHEKLGQLALGKAGLLAEFQALSRPEGQAMRILDTDGTVLRDWQPRPDDPAHPEIDRGQLRDLLLGPLDVQWGRDVTGVVPGTRDGVLVHFADGRQETFDLVIGADGAWSRIRPRVSAARPAYSGLSFVEADLLDADARHPKEAAIVGNGILFALADGKGLLGHRTTSGKLHIYTALRAPEDWLDAIDFDNIDASKATVLAEFEDWDQSLTALVANADGPLVPRRINALPVGHRWDRVPGVTLLGDAAHVMSPFAGEGANLAMLDGALLGQSIAEHPGETESALASYEEELFPRSAAKAQESVDGIELCFGENAVNRLVEMFSATPPDNT